MQKLYNAKPIFKYDNYKCKRYSYGFGYIQCLISNIWTDFEKSLSDYPRAFRQNSFQIAAQLLYNFLKNLAHETETHIEFWNATEDYLCFVLNHME